MLENFGFIKKHFITLLVVKFGAKVPCIGWVVSPRGKYEVCTVDITLGA